MRTSLTIAALAVALLCAPAHAKSRYHSAKCLSLAEKCSKWFERRSGTCKAGLMPAEQSDDCRVSGCRWCALSGKADKQPCTSPIMRELCDLGTPAMPSPMAPVEAPPTMPAPVTAAPTTTMANEGVSEPEPEISMKRKPDACTWMGDDSAVVDLGQVDPAEGWTPVERDGMMGLVYRKDLNHGIEQPGKGEMCFPVKLAQAGDYFLTAVSYAPHHTEWNDDWMAVNKRLRLWQISTGNSFMRNPMTYLKAYQNNGAEKGMSTEMKTKDHDGHRFIVMDVNAGETIKVCMSGRSYRYEVYRLVLQKCFGNICSGGNLSHNRIMNMPVSQCM